MMALVSPELPPCTDVSLAIQCILEEVTLYLSCHLEDVYDVVEHDVAAKKLLPGEFSVFCPVTDILIVLLTRLEQ